MMKKFFGCSLLVWLVSLAGLHAQSITEYETPVPAAAVLVTPGTSYTVPDGMVARLEQVLYNPHLYFDNVGTVAGGEMSFVFCGKKLKCMPYTRTLSVNGQVMYFSDGNPNSTTTVMNNKLPLYLPEGTVICAPEGHQTVGASLLLYPMTR